MKKTKKYVALLLCFLLSVGLVAGCGKEEEEQPQKPQVEELDKDDVLEEPDEDSKEEQEDDVDVEVEEPRDITLYYADEQTGEMATKTISVRNEQEIWKALQESGILTEDCALNSVKVDDEKDTMELDFNKATGDRVRSMGTTGEMQIVGSIVNTFLDAYDCDSVKLTEEGEVFASGHAIYDGYNGKMEY